MQLILSSHNSNKGFTIIELVSVLVIIGIIGALATTRMIDSSAESISSRAVIKGHIRYAQIMAMKSNTTCGVVFNTSSYSMFKNDATADRIALPGNDGTNFSIPSSLGTAIETIYFDLWGIPYTDSALTTQRATGAIGSLGIIMTTDTGFVQ